MAESILKQQGWRLIATSTGGNTVTFPSLSETGYQEVLVHIDGRQVGWCPVKNLPQYLTTGGYHSGPYGLLLEISITDTSMRGTNTRQDSTDISVTWYLEAR